MKRIQVTRPGLPKTRSETVGEALQLCANALGIDEILDLNCEAADPYVSPEPGIMVWVWPKGEDFDADTACSLAVPSAIARIWNLIPTAGARK